MISQAFPKSVILVSLLLLCMVLAGGSTQTPLTQELKVDYNPIQKDSINLDKLQRKLSEYEMVRKSKP